MNQQDLIATCRKIFNEVDQDNSGEIEDWELHEAFEKLGISLSEDDLKELIAKADNDMNNKIDFGEFYKIVALQLIGNQPAEIDQDLLDAFVSCGGNPDKSGFVKRDHLIKIIKIDFELEIDIEKMIRRVDKDGNGEIDFKEFSCLFTDTNLDDEDDGDSVSATSSRVSIDRGMTPGEVSEKVEGSEIMITL